MHRLLISLECYSTNHRVNTDRGLECCRSSTFVHLLLDTCNVKTRSFAIVKIYHLVVEFGHPEEASPAIAEFMQIFGRWSVQWRGINECRILVQLLPRHRITTRATYRRGSWNFQATSSLESVIFVSTDLMVVKDIWNYGVAYWDQGRVQSLGFGACQPPLAKVPVERIAPQYCKHY